MATIKSYSDLQQSRKLAEILPLESADMYYVLSEDESTNMVNFGKPQGFFDKTQVAWSIASLLGVLPNGTDIVKDEADTENEHYMCTVGIKDAIIPTFGKNPIDACVDMILKLRELKML